MSLIKVLVTGAAGFVGSALLRELQQHEGLQALGLCRTLPADVDPDAPLVAVGDLADADADLSAVLQDVDVVIHAAGRAHVMQEVATDPLAEYRHANVEVSLNLARQAAAAGARRFVFISSIKVNGESTSGRGPYAADQTPAPEDAYGISKHEAEQALQAFCAEQGMELVIVRSPLVYGPGVKANFASLMRLCEKSVPLPFGSINNRRSMLYLGNLVDFFLLCVTHPAAANQLFLVSDRNDLSLAELVAGIRSAMGRKPWLLPVPAGLFRLAGRLSGKQAVVERLVGDLQVDAGKAHELLDWQPPYRVEQGLAATVAGMSVASGVRNLPLMRALDVGLSLFGLVFGLPVLLLIYVLCLFDTGSPLLFQERVGRNKKPFILLKFRTMKLGTEDVATHLACPDSITRLGAVLRKGKLDELPQLWNVLKGEMSLVGPRPSLYNQTELIAEREARGIYAVRPGITGLGQVNRIDMSTPQLLAEADARMIRELSLGNYFKFIVQTVTGKGSGDAVSRE